MSKTSSIKYYVRKRIFLNKDTEMRAIAIAVVEDTREIPNDNEDGWKYGTIELTLGDCYRQVSYDFNLSSKENRANSLYKIRRIAEIVNAVHEAIELEAESIAGRKVPKPKDEKPKVKGAAA